MTLDIETITNSSLGISLLSSIAGMIPPRVGHRIADFAAERIAAQRNSKLARAVRGNQWVVLGEEGTSEVLDRAVRDTLRHSARSVFDLYHYLRDPEATGRMIALDVAVEQLAKRSEFENRGLVAVGVHLSNFDLILRWLCQQGFRPLVLTISDARGGRRTEYEMREQLGMKLVPATVAGFRRALRHLQRGGAVLTAIDRPISRPRLLPRFFGRPAALPVHHIFLATRARVPVAVVAAVLETDGKYHVRTSELVEMEGDHGQEIETLRNAEKVLSVAEGFIRQAPQQWSVPLPVWPSTMGLVPE
jgi:KDO2-lipid IV(A) lauroyltransferase